MKSPSSNLRSFRAFFLLFAGLAAFHSGAAQTAAPGSKAAPAAADVTVLQPFEVTASNESEGYRVSSASTATRTNTALINIPQSVSIITEALWRDTASTTFQDSFRFIPGAFVRDRNAGFGGVNLRGFENSSGFATDGVRIAPYKRDLAGYDRLEVVKGPPSAVQGRGGVAGLLNYILKKPDLKRGFTTVASTVGYEDGVDGKFLRATVDYNAVLNREGTRAARVVVVGQNSDDYIDFMKHKVAGVYPSFRWKLSDKTELIAVGEFLHADTPSREEGHGFNVYPADVRRHLNFPAVYGAADQITPLNIPYSTNAGGPDNTWVENTRAANLFLNQKVADGMFFKQAVHVHRTDVDWHAWEIQDNISRFQNIVLERQFNTIDVVNLQGDFHAQFAPLPWLTTNTLLGYQYETTYGSNGRETSVPREAKFLRLDLAELARDHIGFFSTPRTSTPPVLDTENVTHTRNLGLYVQQDFEFANRFILSGGLRSDKDRSALSRHIQRNRADVVSNLNSWRVSGVVKLTKALSVYAVKSLQNDPELFQAQYGAGVPLGDPRRDIFLQAARQNDLREVGVKGEGLQGRVTFTAAYWKLARKGNSVTLTTNENFTNPATGLPAVRAITQIYVSDAETKGFELEAFGDITPRLTVMTSYVNMDSSEADPSANKIGARRPLRFAPDWSYKFFGKYSFRDAKGTGWVVKAGTTWVGPMAIQVPNGTGIYAGSRYNYPESQHTFDLGAAYRFGRWEADLQVNNVGSDFFYLTRTNPLRSFRLSLSGRF
ncbi:MAG: TonB-dependent receptor [Opitutus sp.]|nr:TonB-dependent receptor [Opitutus sp.]